MKLVTCNDVVKYSGTIFANISGDYYQFHKLREIIPGSFEELQTRKRKTDVRNRNHLAKGNDSPVRGILQDANGPGTRTETVFNPTRDQGLSDEKDRERYEFSSDLDSYGAKMGEE